MIVNEALNTHSNYFVMPRAIYNLGLSAGAIAAYGYLSDCENRNRRSKDRYTCYPSMATIGRAIDRSRKTVEKYIGELVEAGLILTEPTKVMTADGLRWNGNLKYTLLPIEHAIELFHERQIAHLESGVRKKRKAMKKAAKKRERRQKPHDEYVAERSAHEPEELPF